MRVRKAAYRCAECGQIVLPADVVQHRVDHTGPVELAPVLVMASLDE